jgi:CubicO group peptidase (beta-lactamase class C family)
MHRSRRRLIACAAPLLAACAADLARHRGTPLTELARSLGVCATTYAVIKGGRILAPVAVSGCSDRPPPPTDAIFQAASLTKPVVASAVLRLVLSGQLELQAPVSRYLPQGYLHFHSVLARRPGDPSDRVAHETLARMPLGTLLNHTSGLPNWSARPMVPAFAPGARWQYSGEGYMVLQAVIEAVTGQSFERFMQDSVFEVCGMHDTSLTRPASKAARMQTGVAGWLSPSPARFETPVAAASLYTTAEDYARFMAEFLADARRVVLTMSAPVTADAALGLEWSFGWGVERTARGVVLWQWGNNPGFRSFAMLLPESGDGFVVLTNGERGLAMAVPIADAVLPGSHPAFRFRMLG